MRSVGWLQVPSYMAVIALLAVSAASTLGQTSAIASQSKASDDVVGIREAADRFLRALPE